MLNRDSNDYFTLDCDNCKKPLETNEGVKRQELSSLKVLLAAGVEGWSANNRTGHALCPDCTSKALK